MISHFENILKSESEEESFSKKILPLNIQINSFESKPENYKTNIADSMSSSQLETFKSNDNLRLCKKIQNLYKFHSTNKK